MKRIIFFLIFTSQSMQEHKKPYDNHITIDIQEQIVSGNDNKVIIEKTNHKKEKIIIGAISAIVSSAITVGSTLIIHLNKCNSE